jgi:ribonucleoside-diphosphate reductase beta chain
MASLLDLTSQGDVATITDESKLTQVRLQTPQQLYELWERQQWRAHAIDLERDAHDWSALSAEEQTARGAGGNTTTAGRRRTAR